MDKLTAYIQEEVPKPCCTLFLDPIVLVDGSRVGVNLRLER